MTSLLPSLPRLLAIERTYVQSLNLNGQLTTGLWLAWSTVKNGATLNFILGSSATSWGSSMSDAPPSFP